MNDEQREEEGKEESQEQTDSDLPVGIARIHEEWVTQGLGQPGSGQNPQIALEPVIFPEPVGDYRIPVEDARVRLGLSQEAMDRLLSGGGLDSILVRFDDGVRRMVSESALARFIEDSGMDSSLARVPAVSVKDLAAALDAIRQEIADMKEHHARQLQQFKDILLLELRNLKEQDRDLASFVYDLTAAMEQLWPKLRKRKRTPPPGEAAD